jgi:hypothetical protein
MVSGDSAYHGSSGRIQAAVGLNRRGRGRIAGGVSRRIRSGMRSRRRILGPLRWTTSRRHVNFNGELYVADTEDQSIGLDPSMFCSESELQVDDSDVPDSEVKVVPLVVPETPEADWPTAAKSAPQRRLG